MTCALTRREKLETSYATGRARTLAMAVAFGVTAATVYGNQPMRPAERGRAQG
jgi:hypothetical protein